MKRITYRSVLPLIIAMLLQLSCVSATAASSIPAEALKVVNQVHLAAGRKDVVALEKLMVEDFVWSFGGDGSAKQAIAAWKNRPVAFRHLHRVTGMACALAYDGTIVECPRNAGVNYRAGFLQTPTGWRMTYFVAGD